MIDDKILKENPFYLNGDQVKWVKDTVCRMTSEEKIGQVFCIEVRADDQGISKKAALDYGVGAVMCLPASAGEMYDLIEGLQSESRIPLLIAGNLEEGADAVRGATNIANNLEIGATGDIAFAEKMGAITAEEATAIGMNWAFAPVIDIGMNWRNPVIATRVFGSSPDFVAKAGQAFTSALQKGGMAAALKHFPGDGVDERDQHFSPSVNSLSCEDWDTTFGNAYRAGIRAGALTVMAGHIMQPAWSRKICPGITDEEILPASTSKELIQGLLRNHLGFQGMISTDATTMSGFDQLLPRSQAIPLAIAAGCDMILFTNNLKEDFTYLKEGLEKGIVGEERLEDAVIRILAVKAALGLSESQKTGNYMPEREDALQRLGRKAYLDVSRECADRAVTLVKDKEHIFPLNPGDKKRIYLFTCAEGRGRGSTPEEMSAILKEKLEERGFQVICHVTGNTLGGESHERVAQEVDLILYAANLNSVSNKTVTRLDWYPSMGKDAPTFLEEIPTVFLSFGNPYHLVDVPRVKTFINAYKFKDEVIDAVLDKMTGKSAFQGQSPVDPFCGFWDTGL